MGFVGLPEMAVTFVIALVLFGPKKLPELGRMFGTAISHFRRVRSEMKATFDRELQNLERQARPQKEIDGGYRHDNGNYDDSSSGAMIGGELFASSSPERRDSTISVDSGRWRSGFRNDVDQDYEVMPITIPTRCRSQIATASEW
jgi:sec-independent protein translocase protein TatA